MWRDELTRRFPDLSRLGEDCYVVGGAIRDLLLGIEPADADVACPDPLEAAKRIQDRVIRLGDQEHLSAWRVVSGSHLYDFAATLDGDIHRDLARRDFTVNAMAVDLANDELIDPFGGRRDIEARLVRMIRASNFDDDPLRTLKAVRLAVKYDMQIDPATLAAIRERAARIVDVAVERVTYELSIIFTAGRLRKAIGLLHETGLAGPLGLATPDIREDDVSLAASYALLVSDPVSYARRWRWSDRLLRDVVTLQRLAESHDRMELFDAGETVVRQLPAFLRALARDAELELPDFSIRPLLTGHQISTITAIGPGPAIGRIKRALLEAQAGGDVRTREEAEAFVRGLKHEQQGKGRAWLVDPHFK